MTAQSIGRRLLFVVHQPDYGGPHNRALRLAAPLAEHGWATHVLLPDEPGNAAPRFRDANVPTTTTRLHRARATRSPVPHVTFLASFVPEVIRIRRLISALDIDLVVIGGLMNPHAAFAGRLAGVPVIWQIIDTRAPQTVRNAYRPLIGRLATVVMTTGTTVGRDHGIAEKMADRWVPFFSPVDVGRFAPDPDRRARARSELGFTPDDVVVGTVGTINPQKGFDTFIRAAAELKAAHPDTRFLILGSSHDTHEHLERRLWGLAGNLGLQLGRDLVVRDPESRVDDLAQALDVFWLTAQPRSEGVPTAVMEAMALALPVVATDVGGVREIVEEGVTGIVVPPQSPTDQARVTAALLDDPAARAEMGRAGRERAKTRFRTKASLDTHLRAFELALELHQQSRR